MTNDPATQSRRSPIGKLAVVMATALPLMTQAQWVQQGPAPSTGGGTENVVDTAVGDDPIVGAIHTIATHPSDADALYIGAINGGIWKTTNATAASPNWTAQTDSLGSLSFGDISFDTADATNETLIAGVGRFSSFARFGGQRLGVLRTTDGGDTWNVIPGMEGRNITGVVARGTTLLASVDIADTFTCGNVGVFRSTDDGATWAQPGTGLAGGISDVLATDPGDLNEIWTSVTFASVCDGGGGTNGIYRSADQGASWAKVSDAAIDALLADSNGTHVEITSSAGNTYVAIVSSATGGLGGVFRTADDGATWTSMGVPTTIEGPNMVAFGAHPGGQGDIHTSFVVDPTDPNIVYVGGDRQPRPNEQGAGGGGFPNSINANGFNGRLFRGVFTPGPDTTAWAPLTHIGTATNSSPHADSRDMAFDAAGNLIQSDDGGVYARTSPRDATGDWIPKTGDLGVIEAHSTIYDETSNRIFSGLQDNGTNVELTPGGEVWEALFGGDGGDVIVDNVTLAGSNQSIRYFSFQNLGAFVRVVYNADGSFASFTQPALTVTAGDPFDPAFVTPLTLNQVNPDRIIFGGDNGVYESLDQGDTIAQLITNPVVSLGRDGLAAGSQGNPDLLYAAAADDGNLYQRTTAGGALAVSFTGVDGGVQGVSLSATDPTRAFLIELASVRQTDDTGATWPDITGNLIADFAPGRLWSVEYMEGPGGVNAVAVGADRGVYIATEADGFSVWAPASTDLPNAQVRELIYDDAADRLIAGTLGRGVFALTPVLAAGGNTAPTANNDTLADSAEDQARVIDFADLTTNDDAGDPGQTVTVTAVSNAVGGAAVINGTTVEFTPTTDFVGNAGFDYTITDDGTPPLTASATASFNLTEVNDSPVATADVAADATEDTTLVIAFADLLGNDAPGGGADEAGQTLTITAVGSEVNGTAVINGTTVEFTPAADYVGAASFEYTVSDDGTTSGAADPQTDTATVTLTVTEVNDLPAAQDDTVTVVVPSGSTTVVIPFADLLANDATGGGVDEASQTLTVTAAAVGAGVTSVTVGAADLTVELDAGFAGTPQFTYTATDDGTTAGVADPQSDTATVSLDVLGEVVFMDSFETPL